MSFQPQHTIIYVSDDQREVQILGNTFLGWPYHFYKCTRENAPQFIEEVLKSEDTRITQIEHRQNMQKIIIEGLRTLSGKAYCIFIKHGAYTVPVMCYINGFISDMCNYLVLDIKGLYQDHVKPNEIYVIVGRADELETELNEDIRVACIKAGFDSERTTNIMQRCNCNDNTCVEIEERSENTLLRILMLPTVEEFETFMKKAIYQCSCAGELSIIYCGHGTEDGNICLFDDDYSGAQLCSLLCETSINAFPKDTTFYFNCCYAVNVMAKMLEENVLQKLIDLAPIILNGDAGGNSHKLIMEAYYGDQIANTAIQEGLKKVLVNRSFFPMKLRGISLYTMYLYPLSVGELKAEGLIWLALKVKQDAGIIIVNVFRSRQYRSNDYKSILDEYFPIQQNKLYIAEEMPKITVFGAKHGDSALFSWKDWNILIDGGPDYSFDKLPCYLEKIKTLNKLDLVVLTHGDCDHVDGLLPFFKKMANDKGKNKFVAKAAFLHFKDDLRASRGWSHACELYKYAKEAGITCSGVEPLTRENGQSKLTVKFIHPPPGDRRTEALEKLAEAMKATKKNRSTTKLTLINRTSLVVYIKCEVEKICTHRFLFTGDADGIDVITALRAHHLDDKVFSYVDMPHHGSKTNHPKEFLETIKAMNIGVSTNGSRVGHPDDETIDAICNYMEKEENSESHVYFNYSLEGEKVFKLKKNQLIKTRIHTPAKDATPGFTLSPLPIIGGH